MVHALDSAIPLTAGSLVRAALSLFTRRFGAAWSVWLVALVMLTATNVAVVAAAEPRDLGFTEGQLLAFGVRLLAVLWILAAAYRAQIGSESRLWALDPNFWRYFFAQIVVSAITLSLSRVLGDFLYTGVHRAIADGHSADNAWQVVSLARILLVGLIFIRIMFWPVARAIGDRAMTLAAAWRATRGAASPIAGAWLVLIGPLVALRYVVALQIQDLAAEHRFWIAAGDGAFSAIVLIAAVCTISAAYKALATR